MGRFCWTDVGTWWATTCRLLNGMLGFVSPVPAPEEEEADVPLPRTENKME
jgi:hypothetical protein